MAKRLRDYLSVIQTEVIRTNGDLDTAITAPVVESDHDLESGGIFVARRGLTTDGHHYIPNALEKGAAAIVGEIPFDTGNVPYIQVRDARTVIGDLAATYHDNPSHELIVIGITGTDGKTTTSHVLYEILKQATYGKTGFISTIAAEFGDAQVPTGLHVTTPNAPQVQAYLAQMRDAGLTHCILEMTSHGLAQDRLQGVHLDVAVMTNVTHEHLDYHGTWEAYRAAKGQMFAMLDTSVTKNNQPKVAVVNADDPSADYFASFTSDHVIRYGIHHDADLKATNIQYSPDHTMFEVNGLAVKTQLIGEFNVANILAAIVAARAVGTSDETIQQAVARVEGVSGRMQRIDEGQDFVAIVDFAHTPNALERVLQAGRQMLSERGRLIVVFGSAGLRDVEKRRLMAEISAQLADFTVLTAEDPRTESLDDILEMMAEGCRTQGGVEGDTFIRVPDRGEAIFEACQIAAADDVVLVCGKGHEQSMCFGTIEYPWDDRDALRSALQGEPLATLPTAKTSKG